MTLDQLLLDAGAHVDRLIDRHEETPVAASDGSRRRWRSVSVLAIGIAAASLIALFALDSGHRNEQQPGDPTPTTTLTASPFDDGAAIIVYLRPGSSPDQVQLVANVISEQPLIDSKRTRYFDATQAVAEVLRVDADDPRATGDQVPLIFKLYASSTATAAELRDLAIQLKALPNTLQVTLPDDDGSEQVPISSAVSTQQPTPTLAPPPTS